MLSVLPKPAAPRGTLRHSGDDVIGVEHVRPLLMQMLLLAFLKNFQANPKLTIIEKRSLEMFINQARTLLRDKWKFIIQHLKDQVLLDSLYSMVPFPTMLGFNTLVKALQDIAEKHYRKMGVPLNKILGCDTIVDAVTVDFHNNDVFMGIFDNHVWVFFRTDLKVANQMARMTEILSSLPAETVSSYAAIVARTAVTFSEIPSLVAQALVPDSQPSDPLLVSEPVSIVRVLPDPPPRDDATDLILAGVKSVLDTCVANAVALATKSFAVGNCSNVMAIAGSPLDAQVLATEVTSVANAQALEATADAIAALEVAEAVKAAANSGESVQRDMLSSTEFAPGDPEAVSLFLEIANESDRQTHENGAGGPLSVIPEEKDGADQSGNSSPHSPDGERRAPFITFAQSPLQGVEAGAPGAHPLSSVDLSRSVDVPKSPLSNLGSNFSSDLSGTSQTHELADLLANLPILSLSSSNPAHAKLTISYLELTNKGVSTPPNLLAMLDQPTPLPTQSSSSRGHDIGVGDAHSSDIQSKNALSNVGVSGNPRANLPSFPPKGDVEGPPPVQVLAQSGNSDDADHPETPSRFNRGSSCIPGRKTGSASQRQEAPQSRGGWWRKFFRWGKSNRVNPSQGETGDTSPQVTHSSDKISSEFAATTTTLLPSSISPLGGNIGGNPGAHSPGDPPEIVPSPAPSSSYELGSAATTALSPQSCPSGHDIGGIEPDGMRSQFAEIDYLVLTMKYASAPWTDNPPLLWTHPCLQGVPNLARLARVA